MKIVTLSGDKTGNVTDSNCVQLTQQYIWYVWIVVSLNCSQ